MKRHISTLLAAAFVIACLLIAPATARAEEVATTGTWGTNITWTYDQETKTLTFTGNGDMDEGSYDEETGWFTDDEISNWNSLYYVGVDHIVVGEGITSLCPYAFCEFLCKSISLPSTLKTLRPYSLDTSCTGILKLPSSIERVDSHALSHQAVEYDGPMTAEQLGCLCLNGYLEDGILYDSQEKTILYLCYSEAASITIPDSVKTIKANAFLSYYRNSKPLSVVVPDTVETVEDKAFTDVDHVTYHGSLATSSWGAKVVNGYEEDGMIYKDSTKTNLLRCTREDKNIVIPDTVLVIGPSIFRDTKDNVTVPATVTEISNYAFNYVGNVNYEGSLTWTY